MPTKICTKCKANKEPGEFYGKMNSCKKCHLECCAKRYAANKERIRANIRAWAAKNPDSVRANTHARRVIKAGSSGRYSAKEWRDLLEAFGNKCLRCGSSPPRRELSPDHVIPVSRGGSGRITNIQPLCRACNNWKRAKTIDYRGVDLSMVREIEAAAKPFVGKKKGPMSPDHKMKISIANSGRPQSPEHRTANSAGVKASWESRRLKWGSQGRSPKRETKIAA